MKHTQRYETLDRFIFILIGGVLAFVFHKAAASPYNAGDGMWHGLNFNLVVYAGALAGSFLLFLVLGGAVDLLRRHGEKKEAAGKDASSKDAGSEKQSGNTGTEKDSAGEIPRKSAAGHVAGAVLYGIYGVVGASLVLLIYEIYINEYNLYPGGVTPPHLRQEVNHRLYFLMIAACAAALFFTLPRLKKEHAKNRPFRISTAVLWAVINGAAVYCPNIFEDVGAGPAHIHAVTNSIVNVMHHAPFDLYNVSIYGHYGLLYAPLVKLLGGNFSAVMAAIAVTGFLAFLAAFYVADRLIDSEVMYLFAVVGMTGTTTILTRRGQYLQINPLRLLFPAVMLAVITGWTVHKSRKSERIYRVLLVLTGIASFIWNTETGLFAIGAAMCTIVMRGFYSDRIFSKRTLRNIILALFYGAVCIAAAWAIVGLYNIACGGRINTVREYIYPFMSGTYNVNHLRVPLPSEKYLYFFQILLFFLTALAVLRKQHLKKTESEEKDTIRFAVSVMGLFVLVYFMNRAAYGNMAISHMEMCILLASGGEYALTVSKEHFRENVGTPSRFLSWVVSAVLFFGSVWMAIEGALYVEVCLDYRANSSWKTENLTAFYTKVRETVPEDTFAFGPFIPELYYELGWDNGNAMIDWTDMNDRNLSYIMEEAKKHDRVFTDADFDDPDYTAVASIDFYDYTYVLYERK